MSTRSSGARFVDHRRLLGEYVGDASDDLGHNRVRIGPVRGEGTNRTRPPLQRDVEQFHGHAGLTDIDADNVPIGRIDAQQHPGPAAPGLNLPGLDDEPIVDQLCRDGAHRRARQSGELTEFESAQRAIEEQFRQQNGAVLPTDIAGGGSRRVHGRTFLA